MSEPSANQHPHIVVLGLMGVGKSTTARAVARARNVACHDSDHDLETVFGRTGAELADQLGVNELHRLESAMLLGRLASEEPSVISAAAWIVEDDRCVEALANRATVAVLHAPLHEVLRRAATGAHRRLMSESELSMLASRRAPLFAAVADVNLDATRPTADLVTEICNTM